MVNNKLRYDRVLLKISGELFGVELALVIGGGNIFRGKYKAERVDEATADYMGMLATIINGMGLQEALERLGAPTRMMTAIELNLQPSLIFAEKP